MRRIPTAITLLILMPGMVEAYTRDVPLRYRVRYSPYALSYHNSGLIPGGVTYSPYAFSPQNSGLAFEGVRYSPYAYSYGNSGLVVDYYWWPMAPWHVRAPQQCTPARTVAHNTRPPSGHVALAPLATSAKRSERDAMQIIQEHLRQRGFQNARINHILRVDNEIVSVDFMLADRALLIKYWNPEAAEALRDREPFKQKVVERYAQDWANFARAYQQGGGTIYRINASQPQEIVAALESCDDLRPDSDSASPPVLYAKQ